MQLPPAIEHLLTEMSARYGLDVGGMASGVRARLSSRLPLSPLPIDRDLEQRAPWLRLGSVRNAAFEAPRLRKLVLSEVRLFPAIEGFALTLLPAPSVRAPVFLCDFLLLPAALSVNADLYGRGEATGGIADAMAILAPLQASFAALGGRPAAAWARSLTSGQGLHARVSPRLSGEAYGALTAALGLYLDALGAAATSEPAAQAADQAEFFRALHQHGPRRRMSLLFGSAWAERYSRLMFE
jgi:hypothetical protein